MGVFVGMHIGNTAALESAFHSHSQLQHVYSLPSLLSEPLSSDHLHGRATHTVVHKHHPLSLSLTGQEIFAAVLCWIVQSLFPGHLVWSRRHLLQDLVWEMASETSWWQLWWQL